MKKKTKNKGALSTPIFYIHIQNKKGGKNMIDKNKLDEIINDLENMGFTVLDKYEYEADLEQEFLRGYDACYEKYGLKQHEERW